MPWFEQFETAATILREAAFAMVRNDRGIRVEDYLTMLGSATGEAVIVTSGLIDIEDNDLIPGSALFGEAIHQVLTGGGVEAAEAGRTSVVGLLRDRLVPGTASLDDFGSLDERFRSVAAHTGQLPWGGVHVEVPAENQPLVVPMQVAFALRPVVAKLGESCDQGFAGGSLERPEGWGPHVLCALALASAIEQTKEAIDLHIGIRLSLDIVFGMAKMVPMSKAAFDRARQDG